MNGALSNDIDETWPIFNYNGVTYFPLTYRYAYDSFGWGYQWDSENGLRIDTTTAPARVPVEPNTGDAALDKALTILNNSYAAGGKYRSTLENSGKKQLRCRARRQQPCRHHLCEIHCRAVSVL